MKKLHEQLQTVSGKKVYGYLPHDVKRTVDDVLAELAKDKQISQLYEKWCELERLKHKIYMQREPELPPLADNKVFKPVKNMIIRTVLEMQTEPILADQGKAFVSYRLAQSAEDGNEQAEQLLENMEQRETSAFASTIFGLFVSLSRMIEDDYNRSHKKLQSKVDSKIQHMIRKHKQELGIRDEHDMTMA